MKVTPSSQKQHEPATAEDKELKVIDKSIKREALYQQTKSSMYAVEPEEYSFVLSSN